MSLNTLITYEKEFEQQVGSLEEMMKEPTRLNVYFKAAKDPKEYS